MKNLIIPILLVSGCCLQLSCKKWVEVPAPAVTVNAENVYSQDKTAIRVLTGIYITWSQQTFDRLNTPVSALSLGAGLSSDEFQLIAQNGGLQPFYQNTLTPSMDTFWTNGYTTVQVLNQAIEGLSNSKTLTPKVKQNLLGQARFLRGFYYFYLTNLYGPVPLIIDTDYKKNRLAPRSSIEEIYKQIISDLITAESDLSDKYLADDVLTATDERTIPTKWAAKALLARVYLYNRDYEAAEVKASEVIANTNLFGLQKLNEVFLSNSHEAIWQLQPVNANWNTEEAKCFIIPPTGPATGQPIAISDDLLASYSPGDARRTEWLNKFTDKSKKPEVDYYYPFKYRSATQQAPVTEYSTVLRLAEQYLILAEAKIRNGKIAEGITDLNILRRRSRAAVTKEISNPLPDLAINLSEGDALDAVINERRWELFSEWGHRWLDLKRTGKVDAVMNGIAQSKGVTWSSYKQLYPIRMSEILSAPNLTQNNGY